MKTLLQISSTLNYGAPGKIAEQIGILAKQNGWNSYIAHGNKYKNTSELESFQTVSPFREHWHEAYSLLFDGHGLSSDKETRQLCKWIDSIRPDVIHLHNIHGYFLNYKVLFDYLGGINVPLVWTLHDCWPFTGHCSHFDFIGCDKWKTGCEHCPGLKVYPKSLFVDRSKANYELKKRLFSSVANRLTLVPVSDWIAKFAKESFLSKANIKTIHNGIDVDTFSPCPTNDLKKRHGLKKNELIILGVASPWTQTKGPSDWVKLFEILPKDNYKLIMIGLNECQIATLPKGMIGIGHTNSVKELAQYYSLADVFLNTTYQDNYPTVNLEAISCGTPVITYNTGGSPEAITQKTGWVVKQGNLGGVKSIIESLALTDKHERELQRMACRDRAIKEFDKNKAFYVYLELYDSLSKT